MRVPTHATGIEPAVDPRFSVQWELSPQPLAAKQTTPLRRLGRLDLHRRAQNQSLNPTPAMENLGESDSGIEPGTVGNGARAPSGAKWRVTGHALVIAYSEHLRHHGQAETHDLLPAPQLPGPEVDGGPEDPLKTFIFSISGGSSAGAWWWEHVTDVYQSSIPGGSLCGRVALNIRLPVVVTALPTLSLETAWASDVKLTTSSPGGMA